MRYQTFFLAEIAKTGKSILLSNGMSGWEEIDEAVETLKNNGCVDLTVLQCTSEYPCPPEESGLNVLYELRKRYNDIKIGYSDHTLGLAVPIAAVMKGAAVIEKHFTLSKKMYGSDAKFATEPNEFKKLVEEIRNAEKALSNKVDKNKKADALKGMKYIFEKSIVAARNIKKGEIISQSDLAFKKPGNGIKTKHYKNIIGKRINIDIKKDTILKWEAFK